MDSTPVRIGSSTIGTTRMPVTGMTCGSCAATIEMVLTAVPGSASARVDLVSHEAVVEHDQRKAPRAAPVSAIGHGTDTNVAIESTDVTLVSGSLEAVASAIETSRATMRNAKHNLLGAFIYNAVSIPIAAGVLFPVFGILLSPLLAGAATAASSVTVVMNANRLRFFRVKSFTEPAHVATSRKAALA